MIGRPGSAVWLLAHELRLDWRRRSERRAATRYLAIGVSLAAPVLLGLFAGVPMGLALRAVERPVTPVSSALAALGLAVAWTLMLSQAVAAVVEALYERSDLDLLFSSPVRPERVVAVRALAIAFSAFSVFGYFLAGPVVAVALMVRLSWILSLAVFFALALAAAGVALLVTMGLLRQLGPRRTRFAAHILSAVIGGCLFLATQAVNIAGFAQTRSMYELVGDWAAAPDFRPPPFLDWPLRALLGEAGPFAAVTGLAAAIFALGVAVAGPRFADGVARAAGANLPRRRANGRAAPFRASAFAATYRKELRLLLRDPMLVPQVVLRVLYLVPLAFVTARYGAAANITALSGALLAMVLMANQLTGSLAWLTVSAEDARDLLLSAPAPGRTISAAKLVAAATPAAAILSPVLLFLLVRVPAAGLVGLVACLAALCSAGLVNIRWQRPTRRTGLRARRNSAWFVTLVELGLGLLIAVAAALLSQGQPLGLIPAGLAAAGLLAVAVSLRRSAPIASAN